MPQAEVASLHRQRLPPGGCPRMPRRQTSWRGSTQILPNWTSLSHLVTGRPPQHGVLSTVALKPGLLLLRLTYQWQTHGCTGPCFMPAEPTGKIYHMVLRCCGSAKILPQPVTSLRSLVSPSCHWSIPVVTGLSQLTPVCSRCHQTSWE